MATLKFLLDENIGRMVAEGLRKEGLDVQSVVERAPGLGDAAILEWAVKERRVVVTLDKDFGRLVFLQARRHVGVIFLRLQNESSHHITAVLLNVLQTYQEKLAGTFTTVTDTTVRMI
jgi:predicted nuclease of predicted toxin-antitoxin system